MGRAKRCRNDPFFLYTFLGSKCLYYFFSNSYFIELFCVSIQRCQLTIFLKKTCLPPWFPKYSTKPKTKKLKKKKKFRTCNFCIGERQIFFLFRCFALHTHSLRQYKNYNHYPSFFFNFNFNFPPPSFFFPFFLFLPFTLPID